MGKGFEEVADAIVRLGEHVAELHSAWAQGHNGLVEMIRNLEVRIMATFQDVIKADDAIAEKVLAFLQALQAGQQAGTVTLDSDTQAALDDMTSALDKASALVDQQSTGTAPSGDTSTTGSNGSTDTSAPAQA